MKNIRKSTFAVMLATAAFAPFAATANDVKQDDASQPTPFSGASKSQYAKPQLGAPQFITQELIATPSTDVRYARVNGQWVRVDADKDLSVPKPDLTGAGFWRHDG